MAGLIAGAEIMIGGRTPHPYHTRPGMVSQSNDGDPHGKPPRRCRAGTIPALPQGPGELVRVARRLCGHAGQARGHAQSPTRRAHGPTAGAALATEPADRHSTHLHRSSVSRKKRIGDPALGALRPSVTFRVLPGGEPANRIRSSCIGEPASGRVAPCCARSGWPAPAGPRLSAFSCRTGQGRTHAPRDRA